MNIVRSHDATVEELCRPSSAPRFDVGGATRQGRQRKQNEDSFFIGSIVPGMAVRETSTHVRLEGEVRGGEIGLLMILADGMGGLSEGQLASRIAVETSACYALTHIAQARRRPPQQTIPGMRDDLARAITEADDRLRDVAHQIDMGTTLTLAYLVWPDLYVAHVGDTRAYVLRQGQLEQITKDHTLAQELHEQLDAPMNADYWSHVLSNCLGDKDRIPRPEITKTPLHPGDRWLLCSDGLHGALDADTIVKLMLRDDPARSIAHMLVEAAVQRESTDDTTAIYGRRLEG